MTKRRRRKTVTAVTSAGEGKITIMLAHDENSTQGKEREENPETLETELEKESPLVEVVKLAQELPKVHEMEGEQGEEDKNGKKEQKSWSDLFKQNREGDNGLQLKKVEMEGDEVVITSEDVEPEVRFWKFSLIAYIVGLNIPAHVMVNFLKARWRGMVMPHVIKHEDGYFILRFENQEDMECALSKGMQFFYSK